MADGIRWVGLDVHALESTIAIFDQGTGELSDCAGWSGVRIELLPRLRGGARAGADGVRGGPDRLWAGAPRAGAGDRDRRCARRGATERPPA